MDKILKLGYYSNSQNGLVIGTEGVANCICSGGNGHDSQMPKILIRYEDTSDR